MPWTWAPRAKSQSWPPLLGLSLCASSLVPSRPGKVLGKAGGARRAAFDTELQDQAQHLPVGTAPLIPRELKGGSSPSRSRPHPHSSDLLPPPSGQQLLKDRWPV